MVSHEQMVVRITSRCAQNQRLCMAVSSVMHQSSLAAQESFKKGKANATSLVLFRRWKFRLIKIDGLEMQIAYTLAGAR